MGGLATWQKCPLSQGIATVPQLISNENNEALGNPCSKSNVMGLMDIHKHGLNHACSLLIGR